jgi:acetyl-CoA carboxylase biotin carboxylase subunit
MGNASSTPVAARPALFHRLLVANRGEVAARIARTCDRLGIEPVFAVSQADRSAPYTRGRQVVVLGPARASESYLDATRLVQAAVQVRASALHPGWGFLSEDPLLASLCGAHGVSFIGPPPHVMYMLGKKTPAKRAMVRAGLDVIPGSDGPLSGVEEARAVAERVGYPVLFKAESGGGGRGMRVARSAAELGNAFEEARSEARAAFGDDRVYLERLVEGGRHIEIQLLADRHGNAIHLGERDCTIQRNHQKLIEESPAPAFAGAGRGPGGEHGAGPGGDREFAKVLERTCERAVAAIRQIGYVGAGTMEFLLGEDGVLRFMEVNARLQVEHPVTEMRCGLDLMAEQIRIAAGHRLSWTQEQIALRGHAIECRINAEDPARGFRPCPGVIRKLRLPDDQGGTVRVDTHIEEGYEVPPFYDSLLCKIIAHGATRHEARERMLAALAQFRCDGVVTTAGLHQAVLASEAFVAGTYDTRAIPGWAEGAAR